MTDSAAAAAAAAERMDRLERTVDRLVELFQTAANPPTTTAPTPAAPPEPPAESPGLFANLTPMSDNCFTRPQKRSSDRTPPFVFDGDRSAGRAFLHSDRTYIRLVPEAFVEGGELSKEKAVRFTMSFMSKDSAQKWAERMSIKTPFPFLTWDAFTKEFCSRFVEENEQDHALHKLESRAYYMGSRD
ncbi:hypothetical protein R3P38DRAFT_3133939, partial [Favolaschia claudopus]